MRTYTLSVLDLRSPYRKKFRCQAASLNQAIKKAEANHPGFFMPLICGGQRHAAIHS